MRWVALTVLCGNLSNVRAAAPLTLTLEPASKEAVRDKLLGGATFDASLSYKTGTTEAGTLLPLPERSVLVAALGGQT